MDGMYAYRMVALGLAILLLLSYGPEACASQTGDSLGVDTGDSLAAQAVRDITLGDYRFCWSLAEAGAPGDFERADMTRLSAFTSAGLLAADAALDPVELGGYGLPQHLRVRAGRPHEVVFLLDGIPFADPQTEVVNLSWLPLVGVSRLEILKGGASLLGGSGAVSGAVNVVSLDAESAVPLSRVLGWWGDFDTRFTGLDFRRMIAGRFGFMGAYENGESGGWTRGSSASNQKFYGKVSGALWSNLGLDLFGLKYEGTFELPDSCPDAFNTYPDAFEETKTYLKASVFDRARHAFGLTYYWTDASYPSFAAGGGSRRDGSLSGVEVSMNRKITDSLALWLNGGHRSRRLQGEDIGDRSSRDLHLAGSGVWRSDAGRLTGGVSLAKAQDLDIEYAALAAAEVRLGLSTTAYARADRGYGFPRFDMLYRQGPAAGPDERVGTEHSLGVEVGLERSTGAASMRIAGYWRDIEDATAWRTDGQCNSLVIFNADSEVRGMEVTCGIRYRTWFDGTVSYGLTGTTDESGHRLDYVPKHVVGWILKARSPVTKHVTLGMSFAGRWVSDRPAGYRLAACTAGAGCLASARLPGYETGVLALTMTLDEATVFLRARNLFSNEIEVRWGRPRLPGRTYEFGVSWELID